MKLPDPRLMRLSPLGLVAVTLYGEARGEPIEGIIGVGCVLRTRALSEAWYGGKGSYHKAILRWAQFSSLWQELDGGSGNWEKVIAYAESLRFDPQWNRTQLIWIARGIVDGYLDDNTDGATHFYASWMDRKGMAPEWAKASGAQHTVTLGGHKFYKNIP